MAHPAARLVVWKSPADLLWVKDAFYPPADSTTDQRSDALNLVRIWSIRGKLPHSIESTAMLTEVIMHDRIGASQLHLQLSYATAICRFVNGLLDPAQQSQFAVSMHTLARNLNLPASFVEIRHAATHESLPSLPVLRTAASRALEWLWTNYWVWVGATPDAAEAQVEEPQDSHLSKARMLLKQWRKLRRENPSREIKHGENVPESREALAIMRECATICITTDGLDALIDSLLEEKALIPSGKRKSSSLMRGAFSLWLPLLESLDATVPTFGEQLITSILETFKSTPTPTVITHLKSNSAVALLASAAGNEQTSDSKEFNKALLSWAKLLCGNSSVTKFGKQSPGTETVDTENVVKQCILCPNEWALDLLHHILKHTPTLKTKYSQFESLAKEQISVIAHGSISSTSKNLKKRPIEDIEDELSQWETRYARMEEQMNSWMKGRADEQLQDTNTVEAITEEVKGTTSVPLISKTGKWSVYQGVWTPRPIGVM